jgi:hypothetical protein
MKAQEAFLPWHELEEKLKALELALDVNDVGVIRLILQDLVTGYTPSDAIVDWVHLAHEVEVM